MECAGLDQTRCSTDAAGSEDQSAPESCDGLDEDSAAKIGSVALRFTAGLFVRWLELYPRLETAGYTAVGFVGLKLIVGLLLPGWPLPEWFTLVVVASLVLWGFSRRTMALVEEP